jgi:hypothetical protein
MSGNNKHLLWIKNTLISYVKHLFCSYHNYFETCNKKNGAIRLTMWKSGCSGWMMREIARKWTPTQIPRDLLTPKINKNLTEHGQMPTKLSLLVNNRKECHENFDVWKLWKNVSKVNFLHLKLFIKRN